MLYDQAQLLSAYVTAYQISRDEDYANVARDIIRYVGRDLLHQEGGFYSAEDADSLPSSTDAKPLGKSQSIGKRSIGSHTDIQRVHFVYGKPRSSKTSWAQTLHASLDSILACRPVVM